MKFKLLIPIAILWMSTLLTSCVGPGLGDWSLKLPNGYEMWHLNSTEIHIGYKDSDNTLSLYNEDGRIIGIQGLVIKFCMNDRYVCAQQVYAAFDPNQKVDESNPNYFIVDTQEQKVYGPYNTQSQFDSQCMQLDISGLSKWERTSPHPRNINTDS